MNMFTTTAYNPQGQVQETETQTDSWAATEICLGMSQDYGYAETLDAWGRHYGDYGHRPTALGQRVF